MLKEGHADGVLHPVVTVAVVAFSDGEAAKHLGLRADVDELLHKSSGGADLQVEQPVDRLVVEFLRQPRELRRKSSRNRSSSTTTP
jgi:hypothetical protein